MRRVRHADRVGEDNRKPRQQQAAAQGGCRGHVGGGLLGYVAAEMMITDPVVVDRVIAQGAWIQAAAPIAGVLLVIGIAQWLKRRQPASAMLGEHHHP